MAFEKKVIGMLEQIMVTLDEHSQILGEHSQKFDIQAARLDEHGQLLSALITGQEYLKAEIDGMKISNAKEFGTLKGRMDDFTVNIELLRNESWEQKADIHRIKNTMGMS